MEGRIGDELRQEREACGIELEDVEAATGVRARFLAAIEDEAWDELPGEFYARAFTRTYARYLGLDPAEFALEHRPDHVGEGAAGPRVEPELVPKVPSARKGRPWLLIAGALGALALVAIVVAIAAISGGGSTRPSSSSAGKNGAGGGGGAGQKHQAKPPPKPPGTSLTVTATAEVWVCLLDGSGTPLIDGEILQPGSEAGPFSSHRYSMSFGNGSVELVVDGSPANTPESSSPVGFAIDSHGALSEIPEGERPECA